MTVYVFGVIQTPPAPEVAQRLDAAARDFGGCFVETNTRAGSAPWINGGLYAGWFELPDRGHDGNREAEIAIRARCRLN